MSALDRMLSKVRDHVNTLNEALELYEKNSLDTAASLLLNSIVDDVVKLPERIGVKTLLLLVDILLEQKKPDAVLAVIRKLVKMHPHLEPTEDTAARETSRSVDEGNNAEVQIGFEGQAHIAVNSARAILQKGQWKAAKKYLQVALHLHGRFQNQSRSLISLYGAERISSGIMINIAKAQMALVQGNPKKALRFLTLSYPEDVQSEDMNALLAANIGYVFYRLGAHQVSSSIYKKAFSMAITRKHSEPQEEGRVLKRTMHHSMAYNVGLIELQRGCPESAMKFLLIAARTLHQSFYLWLRLGEAAVLLYNHIRYNFKYKEVGEGKYQRIIRAVNEEHLRDFNEHFNQKIDLPVDLLLKAKSYFRCCKAMLAVRRDDNLKAISTVLSDVDHSIDKYTSDNTSTSTSEYKFDSESQALHDNTAEKQYLRVEQAADRNLEYIEHQLEWIATFKCIDKLQPN